MFTLRKSLIVLAAAAGIAFTGASAASAGTWQQNHPARTEINHRLANQHARIREERKEGEISARQAARLHAEDHRIRMQERRMAMRDHDGGHLNAHQVRKLNHEENQVSRQIPR